MVLGRARAFLGPGESRFLAFEFARFLGKAREERLRAVLWSYGPVVLWSCGPMVLWSWEEQERSLVLGENRFRDSSKSKKGPERECTCPGPLVFKSRLLGF
ncbi:hypothetical protein BOO92_20200 [Vibrio navarrensis]|nr:hypothetical protein [Vibrio navarrensis]